MVTKVWWMAAAVSEKLVRVQLEGRKFTKQDSGSMLTFIKEP